MTVSGIGSQVNELQALKTKNAFQKTLKNLQEKQTQEITSSHSERTLRHSERSEESHGRKADSSVGQEPSSRMTDIKNFANQYSLQDVDDDDIKYAMRYGTSLFADYCA